MIESAISRRSFLETSLGAMAAHSFSRLSAQMHPQSEQVLTVRGPIGKDSFGIALPHEHVICDFIGANETGSHRWDPNKVFERMLPYLQELKAVGASTFFDCTPAYIGRDPKVLSRLSTAADLNIITNTGFYGGAKDKYVPEIAYQMSAEKMAAHWRLEYEEGIDGTAIRPGFIKIGVDSIATTETPLPEIDATIVRAAAMVSRATQLSVTCHTGGGYAGLAALQLFTKHGGEASSFIVAHADNHGLEINQKVADLDGWVSFDAIGRRPLKLHLETVPAMLAHRADRLLLSQDNGWYSVGEENGGKVRGYTDLIRTFLPALEKAGIAKETLAQLMSENPWNAFAIKP